MSKEEREFHHHDEVSWTPVAADSGAAGEGMTEKILNFDPEAGVATRMLRFAPGVETEEVITHDFWEEVYIIEGELQDTRINQTFTIGMSACRPPGMPHGPYSSPIGCTTFEVRYYCR
ncbi:MAG: cupin domain-containing protein [Dehalococcoidia bacterium]|nr:cupin domain-containing protein [Dehalococcoidia bacterium]